jgi:NTE family protein
MGADIVIAVDVNAEGATFLGPSLSIISVMLQSMMVVQRTASLYQLSVADVVIKPRVGHIRWDEMRRGEELITAGYEAGMESMPEIELAIAAATRTAPKWYQLRRRKEIPAKRPITSLINS